MMQGVMALFSGLRLLLAKSELRSVLWRMLALLLALMCLSAAGVYWLVDYLALMWIPEGDAWYWQLLGWLAWLLALLLGIAGGVAAYVVLATSVAAPWLDRLAAESERLAGIVVAAPEQSAAGMVLHSLLNTLRPLLELLAWGVAAVLLLWLPPVATALWAWGSVRFLRYELIDVPVSRRGWDFAARRAVLKQGGWFHLSFAATAMLLLMVPLLNLLVIPAAVVALSSRLGLAKAQAE